MNVAASPCQAHDELKDCAYSEQEEFWVLALASNKRVISKAMIFRGTADQCLVHPRDVFKFAITQNASAIIIAHNHPSGDISPSSEDNKTTAQMVECGKLLGIPVCDHLILSGPNRYSYMQEGGL